MNDRNSSNHSKADLASGSTNNDRGVRNGGRRTIRDKIKLPTMKLPECYGAYDQCLALQDSCLRGEAAQLIQSIKVSDGNYDVAWDLLRSTYENKRLIVDNHIKALFDIISIKSESHQSLRKLITEFSKNLSALEVLVDKTELADKLLINILTSKLDTSTRSKYEEFFDEIENPKIENALTFVTKHSNLIEKICTKTRPENRFPGKVNKVLLNVNTYSRCAFCEENHLNYECEHFKKMSIWDRYDQISNKKLCSNCLRPRHFMKECQTAGCRKCDAKHHSLLCRRSSEIGRNLGNTGGVTATSKTPTMPSRGVNMPAASAADPACTATKQTDRRTASRVPLENNEIVLTAQVAGVSSGNSTNLNAERNVTANY
nr:unnamed protein product [Callosobruchus analis]